MSDFGIIFVSIGMLTSRDYCMGGQDSNLLEADGRKIPDVGFRIKYDV